MPTSAWQSLWLLPVSIILLPLALTLTPLMLLLLPFICLSLPFALGIALFVYFNQRHPSVQRVKQYAKESLLFLMPFHGIIALATVAAFSATWSVLLGGFVFAFPKFIDWQRQPTTSSRKSAVRKWKWCLEQMGYFVKPVFEYFPITVRRPDNCDLQPGR
jgi:hypothetical protein